MSVIKIKNRMRALNYADRPFTALVDSKQRAYVLPSDLQAAFNAFLDRSAVTKMIAPITLTSSQISIEKFEHVPFDLSLEIGSAIEAFNCLDVHLITHFEGQASAFSTESFLSKAPNAVTPIHRPAVF